MIGAAALVKWQRMDNSMMTSERHCLRYTTGSEEVRVSTVNRRQLRKGSQVFNTKE